MAIWLDDYFRNPRPVGTRLGAIAGTFTHEPDEPQFIYYHLARANCFPRN